MRALDRLLFVFLLFLAAPASAEDLPAEPAEVGTVLLAGRLAWGATALPTGEILLPCEDQSLSVLDESGTVIARWQAPARFSAPVTVGPKSPLQLLAAPLVNGRVAVLVWDSRTRVLASAFAATHPVEAVATAWSASGQVSFAWKDGHVETWSSQGSLLWSASGSPVQQLLRDDSLGLYAFGTGQAVLYDAGTVLQSWSLEGETRGVLQSTGGELYCWTGTGLWKKGYEAQSFALIDASPNILGVVIDRLDRLVVTEPTRVRRMNSEGGQLSSLPLPRAAVAGSSLDDRGRMLVPTTAGLEVWTYDGRLLAFSSGGGASLPLVTDTGRAAWSTADWKVHLWQGFRLPVFGWPQEGGGAARAFSARRPASVAVRAGFWNTDAEFSYLYQLAASGEEAKQRQVLELFEARATQGDLMTRWPYANLILLKIARSGLTDLVMEKNRVLNRWPALRLRAYSLLSRTAGTDDREELISLLRLEYDPVAAAQGTRALAQSGWDSDGKLMRLLSELRGRMADQAAVADAVIDAARTIWLANGESADPVLIPLVGAVFQGSYPRAVKAKAQKFFQDLVGAD